MPTVKFEDLLGSGAHFGHVTSKWNPNFNPFIFGISLALLNQLFTT